MERQIQNATDAGDGDPQLRALRTRLAADPKDLDARVLLARLYKDRGLPDLALEHYRLAAAQFPDSAIVHIELAKMLRQMDVPQEALRVVKSFLETQPQSNWEALSLEAVLEDEEGSFADAESAHRAAVALQPERSALHNNLGYNLLSQGKVDAAVIEFRRAVELDPKSEIAHNNLGAALAAQPGPASKAALAEFNRANRQAEAHNNLAAILIEQQRYAEARLELQAALKADPGMTAALANWALVTRLDGGSAALPKVTRAGDGRRSLWARVFRRNPTPKSFASAAAVSAPPADSAPAEAVAKK